MKKFSPISAAVKRFALGCANHLHAFVFSHMARSGLIRFDVDPAEVMRELKRIGDQVKETGEKALDEAKKSGDMSAKTKETVDELLVKQGELQARLSDVEKKADTASKSTGSLEIKSTGHSLIESDRFQAFVKAGGLQHSRDSFAMPIKAITSAAGSGAAGVAPDRRDVLLTIPDRRMTVRDLISPGTTESNLIQYVRETGFVNAAAVTAEGTRKPESSITFEPQEKPVVTIPHFIKASKQILDDFKQLQSHIDARLRYGLDYAEEQQLLKGSGVSGNLHGIYTQASNYAAPITPAGTLTRIDILRLALLQAELAEFPSTGIVMHPSDWAAIELLKDSTGAYIFANPQSLAQPGLWGRPVVGTQAMTVDTFLVGAFKLGAQIFDREQANVVIATQNEDDFVKNMITIRGEERLGLAVYRPEAFTKGKITPAA